MNMKKSLMVLFCLSVSYFSMAQEAARIKEIGLVFSNLDNFGLTFKTGTEKSLWRFHTLYISGNNTEQNADSSVYKHNSIGFGVKSGKEYRKNIVKNLDLRLGADLSFTYSRSKSTYDDKTVNESDRLNEQTIYSPGINLVFGLNYVINDHLLVGAELLPGCYYNTGKSVDKNYSTNNGNEVKSDISGFCYGLSNTSALLSLAYRL